MSSTPQTGGFQVSVIPSFQGVNPALFNTAGSFGRGLDEGIAARQSLLQIQQEQALAPLRQSLLQAQIQREQGANRLQDIAFPVAQAEANRKQTEAGLPVQTDQTTFQDLDDAGNLVEYATRKEINPQTGEVNEYTGIPLRTLKTKTQLEQEANMNQALADYRRNLGQAANTRADAWRSSQGPRAKINTVYDAQGNVYQQVVNSDGTTSQPRLVILPDGTPAKRPANQSPFGLIFPTSGAPAGAGAAGAPVAPSASLPASGGGIDPAALAAYAATWQNGGPAQPVAQAAPAASPSFTAAMTTPAAPTPPPNLQGNDLLAYQWARSNPTDPRAAAILARLGIK